MVWDQYRPNIKLKDIKHIGENLDDLGYDFLNTTAKARSMKETSDKLDLLKLGYSIWKTMSRNEKTRGKILAKDTFKERSLSKIYKVLLKLNNTKKTY